MLDEMNQILREAAQQVEDPGVLRRIKSAYKFNITFETGTSLLDPTQPDLDISARMLRQVWKDKIDDWPAFAKQVLGLRQSTPLTISKVIEAVAHHVNVSNVSDMSVILCIDGLEKLQNDGTKTCDLSKVMTAICSFLNSSKAFALCVCSATVQRPVDLALADSQQSREYLSPPILAGDSILQPRSRLERQLVEDMGGHGRALEVLQVQLFEKHSAEALEAMDPNSIVDVVLNGLTEAYGEIFQTPFSQDPCRDILRAVLSRQRYELNEQVGQTGLTVDKLRSLGLFRRGPRGSLDCAFILVLWLLRKLPRPRGIDTVGGDHLTSSLLTWQQFEHFCASFRRVLSTVYRGTPVPLSDLHAGARFGPIAGLQVLEPHERQVVKAVNRVDTKLLTDDLTVLTNQHAQVTLGSMDTVVINGSAGDLCSRIQLTVDGHTVTSCSELIHSKLLTDGPSLDAETYERERAKAVGHELDVFLLITTAEDTLSVLGPRCGVVSRRDFTDYFGPFASRAFRSANDPPDINTASLCERGDIEGMGLGTAEKAVSERQKRRFHGEHEVTERLKPCKMARKVVDALGNDV